jgi:uncharacterized protein (TIGR02231 family)
MTGHIALIAVLCCSTLAAAQDPGRITAVALYPGSATIERSARVAAGAGKVQMTGLPSNFDVRTLRVEAEPGISIGEISVRDVSREQAMSAREAELENRILALKDQVAALDVDVRTAELVRDYLASLSSRPPEGDKVHPVTVDPKAIPAVIDAIRRGGADAYGTIQRIEVRKRELARSIAALERDLARVRGGARDARTLSVSYSASRAGELRAAYQVTNAGWRPAYRAALDSAASRLELERQALVMQRTGEDWSGVKLRLSTGQPRTARIVDPATWQLVIRSPQPRATESLQYGSAPAAAMARAAPSRDQAGEIVAQFHTEYTTEFEVPGKVDIAADGRQVSVSLSTQPIAVKQRVRVVPRRDSAAMVTAEAELPEGVWIPGEVQLYRDGGYIGSTSWQAQAKEKLVLPFGRDDRVQVTTHRVKDRSGSAGLVGQRAERQVATLYTITSRHKLPVELLVLEASPVPVDDKIVVDATFEPKPKTSNWEERRGVVAWEQPIAPGESLKFVADYTITYPRDAVVNGLP